MDKPYTIHLEISGPSAMWTRPDTGDAPVSYPAPTYSAVKGIFESILWIQSIDVVPTKVEICSPVTYHTYTTNYGGPLRKSKLMNNGSSFQLLATVLINVCYRLYANIRLSGAPDGKLSEKTKAWDEVNTESTARLPGNLLSPLKERPESRNSLPRLEGICPNLCGPFPRRDTGVHRH